MLKFIKAIFLCGFDILFSYLGWMIRYAKNPHKYPFELRFKKVQRLIRRVIKALGAKYDDNFMDKYYEDRGEKNTLICANHISYVDPLIFIAAAKKPLTFVCKKEIAKLPFVNKIITLLEGEFLDRDDLKSELKTIFNVQNKLATFDNIDFVIYPEGTRKRENITEPNEYKAGSFRPAIKNDLNIAFFAFYGNQRIASTKTNYLKNAVDIAYLGLFSKEEYSKLTPALFSEEIRNKTSIELKKLKEINDKRMLEYYPKKFKVSV